MSFDPLAIRQKRNRHALDWLNFLLADVTDGLNPFLAMYLLSVQHWQSGRIGIVMSLSGLANVVTRAPLGSIVDKTRFKRALVIVACGVTGLCALGLSFASSFMVVAGLQIVIGTAGAMFAAIPGITLGIVGQQAFARRTGRNEAWNHAGNLFTAALAGFFGSMVKAVAVLWGIAGLALASMLAALCIKPGDIDHDLARGGTKVTSGGLKQLVRNKPFLIFCAAVTLFQFANTGMLPLLAEKLAGKNAASGSALIAACIAVAQAVMVPTAILAGHKADKWGRKTLMLTAFAVLPIRGLLYVFAQNSVESIAIQSLDGFAAGIFFVVYLIITDDLTRGTGTYNLAVGIVSASFGLGQALSNMAAGAFASAFGYSATFLAMAGCGVVALLILLFFMPETKPQPATPLVSA